MTDSLTLHINAVAAMDPQAMLDAALAHRVAQIGARFRLQVSPQVDRLPSGEKLRLYHDLCALRPQYFPLVTMAVTRSHLVSSRFVEDFAGSFRCLYFGLRALVAGDMQTAGPWVRRPSDGRLQEVYEGSPTCAITGDTHDTVPYNAAHIVPWSLARWEWGWELAFFRCVRLLFAREIAEEAWRLSGGRQ